MILDQVKPTSNSWKCRKFVSSRLMPVAPIAAQSTKAKSSLLENTVFPLLAICVVCLCEILQ